jgi:hypothetical protein
MKSVLAIPDTLAFSVEREAKSVSMFRHALKAKHEFAVPSVIGILAVHGTGIITRIRKSEAFSPS